MNDFWPSTAYRLLTPHSDGRLLPTAPWLRLFLQRPELALVEESCPAEQRLHHALQEDPLRAVAPDQLLGLSDADARSNYQTFLHFRDRLLQSGSLQACYLSLFEGQGNTVAPVFVQCLTQALVRHILDDSGDAFEARAGEMLFRTQRLNTQDGQMLCGDQAVLDLLHETGGFGSLGRLLQQAQAPLKAAQVQVLTPEEATAYWASPREWHWLLDLRHEAQQDLGHGLRFTYARSTSGLKALASVLQKWVAHLLGVAVRITPQKQIRDEQWRWHVGLDATSSALLNELYQGQTVSQQRMQQLVSLFTLEFEDSSRVLPEMVGKPVYLGLAQTEEGLIKLKPQNLLINLPLRSPS